MRACMQCFLYVCVCVSASAERGMPWTSVNPMTCTKERGAAVKERERDHRWSERVCKRVRYIADEEAKLEWCKMDGYITDDGWEGFGQGILTCQRGPDGINAEPFCTRIYIYIYIYTMRIHTHTHSGGHHMPLYTRVQYYVAGGGGRKRGLRVNYNPFGFYVRHAGRRVSTLAYANTHTHIRTYAHASPWSRGWQLLL